MSRRISETARFEDPKRFVDWLECKQLASGLPARTRPCFRQRLKQHYRRSGPAIPKAAFYPLADGDFSNGPAYPTAPELAKRAGVPEGRVIEFGMNSSESKFYPGVNGAFQRHVCVYVPAGMSPAPSFR